MVNSPIIKANWLKEMFIHFFFFGGAYLIRPKFQDGNIMLISFINIPETISAAHIKDLSSLDVIKIKRIKPSHRKTLFFPAYSCVNYVIIFFIFFFCFFVFLFFQNIINATREKYYKFM